MGDRIFAFFVQKEGVQCFTSGWLLRLVFQLFLDGLSQFTLLERFTIPFDDVAYDYKSNVLAVYCQKDQQVGHAISLISCLLQISFFSFQDGQKPTALRALSLDQL